MRKAKEKTAVLADNIRDTVEYGIDQLEAVGNDAHKTLKKLRNEVTRVLYAANNNFDDLITRAAKANKENCSWLRGQSKEILGPATKAKKK